MAEEEKLAAEEFWHAAKECACKVKEKRACEDLELEASNDRMKLEQTKEWLRVDTLMKKEEYFQACCNKELALADQEEDRMFDAY